MSPFKPLVILASVIFFAAADGEDKTREKKGLLGLGYAGGAAEPFGGNYGAFFGSYGANVDYDALAALYGPHNVGYGAFGVHGLGYAGHGGHGSLGYAGHGGHGSLGYGGFGAGAAGLGYGGFGAAGGQGGAGLGGFGGYPHGW